MSTSSPARHPFAERPHRTLVMLSLPVMASMVVEPLAGLVDTGFVQRLGAAPASALGAATALLSSILWIFNFLGAGTQTEVALALGRNDKEASRHAVSLALALALVIGVLLSLVAWASIEPAVRWMSDDPGVQSDTASYLRARLVGVPAALVLLTAFGALRGLQDMRTPLWIAGGVSAANIVLDALLIFGAGPIPAFGITGAAWATTASQIAGAGLAVLAVRQRIGLTSRLDVRRAVALLVIGRDMVMRTGALLLFVLWSTRSAIHIGAEAGAAHQALRQIWMLMAFLLDAFAASAQSLVGYFLGAAEVALARRVARVACSWGLGAGAVVALLLLASESMVAFLLVPPPAQVIFSVPWVICAVTQPLNALSFVTDGIHLGTADYAYLRNGMFVATAIGILSLEAIDLRSPNALVLVWLATGLWISVRAVFGVLRLWPGTQTSPLRTREGV